MNRAIPHVLGGCLAEATVAAGLWSPDALRTELANAARPLGAGWPRKARKRAHQGKLRLHRRWRSFAASCKRNVAVNAAVARELAGWCWSLAVMAP